MKKYYLNLQKQDIKIKIKKLNYKMNNKQQ